MKITLNWLRRHMDFVDLSIEELLQKIEEALIRNAMEMEYTFVNPILQVQVLHVEKLSGMKVQMCTVDLKPFTWLNNPNQILCGASNVVAGMYALLAPIGTVINGIRIDARQIRTYTSYGMLLSAQEAGLNQASDGLVQMPAQSRVYSYLDVLLNIKVPFNRWDLHCARGIARILSMEGLGTFKPLPMCHDGDSDFGMPVLNETDYRFSFGSVRSVKVDENVIDLMKQIGKSSMPLTALSEFVMLDIGHPIAIYDTKRVHSIHIRNEADQSVSVISQNVKLSIAGVKTLIEYDAQTTDVVIEAAFLPKSCITTLSTDAAYRFWLGIDHTQMTLAYVYSLINGVKTKIYYSSGSSLETGPIMVPLGEIYRYTSVALSAEKVMQMLRSRGFTCEIVMHTDTNRLNGLVSIQCICPPWRKDVYLPVHVVQEVAMIHGYDSYVQQQLPAIENVPSVMNFADTVKLRLTALDYTEVMALPFAAVGQVRILNPMNEYMPYLRSSLLQSLLEYTNSNEWQHKYFTYDSVFLSQSEQIKLGILLKGSSNRDWRRKSQPFTFFDLKEVVENLSIVLNTSLNSTLPTWAAYGLIYDQGYICKVKNTISPNTYYAELSLTPMQNHFELLESNVSYYDVNVEGEFEEVLRKYKDFYVFDVIEKEGIKKFGITVKDLKV